MSTVSVSKIVTKNYKNIRMEDGIAFGALTVFIGANGSGKSNVISLFQFLQESLTGSGADDQRGRTNFEDAVFRLGGARILDGTLNAPANVGVDYQFAIDGEGINYGVDLFVQDSLRQVIVEKEYLDRGNDSAGLSALFRAHSGREKGEGSGYVSVTPRFNPPDPELSAVDHMLSLYRFPVNELALSALPRLLENTPFSYEEVPLYGPRAKIIESTNAWDFYNANYINLKRIQLSDPKLGQGDTILSPSGENLALVLFNLIQADIEFENSLNELMKDFLPFSRRIRCIPVGRYALTIEWYVEGVSEPFFLSDMSDGTVLMLCWAVILHSPRPPALIVLDEPELGIHPAWMPILAEWIKRAAQKTQIIVTTHSPDLLDHFTDQLDDSGYIYTFQQDPESQNHFRPKRLDRDTVSGWLEDGWQLGDLYRVGNPAVGGWPW